MDGRGKDCWYRARGRDWAARRDEWQIEIIPALKTMTCSVLEKESGLSRRMLIDARIGHSKPHQRNRELLAEIVLKLGMI